MSDNRSENHVPVIWHVDLEMLQRLSQEIEHVLQQERLRNVEDLLVNISAQLAAEERKIELWIKTREARGRGDE